MNSYYEKILATGEEKCIDEEIPFEIPQGWEWCRMGELISYQNGYAYTSSELNKEGKGLPVIKSGNLMTYEVVLKPNNDYVENPSTKMLASAIKKGDLLMCLSSQSDNPEPLGKTAIYKANNTALLNQRVLKMRPWLEDMLEYMYYAINSEYFHYTVSHQGGGSAQANLKLGHVLSMLIPLAPLKEEIRIVDKINTIMPLVHQYETTFLKQKKLNSELNERLKSAILQEAIQGKLVPQINEEGTAQELLEQIKAEKQKLVKEGKLKKSALKDSVIFKGDDNKYYEQIGKSIKCIDDEIPFEIPYNWQWTRLSYISSIYTGNSISEAEKRAKFMGVQGRYYIGTKDVGFDNKIVYDNGISIPLQYERDFRLAPANSILMCIEGGSAGKKIAVLNQDVCFGNKLCCFSPFMKIGKLIYYYLQSPSFIDLFNQNKTGIIGGVSIAKVKDIVIPLPPLMEQQRIVAQIDGLFEQLR